MSSTRFTRYGVTGVQGTCAERPNSDENTRLLLSRSLLDRYGLTVTLRNWMVRVAR